MQTIKSVKQTIKTNKDDRIMKTLTNITAVLSLVTVAWFQPVLAETAEQPVELLERTSTKVIKILRDDRELLDR